MLADVDKFSLVLGGTRLCYIGRDIAADVLQLVDRMRLLDLLTMGQMADDHERETKGSSFTGAAGGSGTGSGRRSSRQKLPAKSRNWDLRSKLEIVWPDPIWGKDLKARRRRQGRP